MGAGATGGWICSPGTFVDPHFLRLQAEFWHMVGVGIVFTRDLCTVTYVEVGLGSVMTLRHTVDPGVSLHTHDGGS